MILTDDTLPLVMEKTGWHVEECIKLLLKAQLLQGRYVVFYSGTAWKRVFIHRRYHVREFMLRLNEMVSR